MNDFYNEQETVIIETPEERNSKMRKQRKLFSRVFLALFLYIVLSQICSIVIYMVAQMVLSPEKYAEFFASSIATVVVSCVSQYLIAFPVFLLTLIGTKKSQKAVKSSISVKELAFYFLIGQSLMYIGNLVGTFLNNFFGALTGKVPENSISEIITEIPIWLIFVMLVIIGPIVEELIFRKLMIDRLATYGDHMAVLFSAIAFGLMHANLYQFFYATLLGLLLGLVYTRTRNVKYTAILHIVTNFMGSIAVLPFEEPINKLYTIMEEINLGITPDLPSLIYNGTLTLIFFNIQFGMVIGGIFVLVDYLKKKKLSISRDKEIYLPDNIVIKNGFVNVGAILFLVVTFILTAINMIA